MEGTRVGNQTEAKGFDCSIPTPSGRHKLLGDLVIVPAAIGHGMLAEHSLRKLFPKSFPKSWFFTQRVLANCNDREKLESQEEQNLSLKFHFVLDQMFLKHKPSPDPNFHFNSIDR